MDFLTTIANASLDAGKEILRIYHTNDFNIEYKSNESPLTQADKNAHKVILTYLKKTGIPVLSEEGRNIPFSERKNREKLWIADPLDGTKEFIKRNGEFTVNIALIENGTPVMGVVYAPVPDIMFIGEKGTGAFRVENASGVDVISALTEETKLPAKQYSDKDYYGIVASRSHLNDETKAFIEEIKSEHKNVKIVTKGSSLKICMVAEGAADIYPRFAPTSEWDTAAGHAVVLAAGGRIVQATDENKELRYNKENLLNPWFIVKRK